jgi:RHS repeat-associated protein
VCFGVLCMRDNLGQRFDASMSQYFLSARYYDPANGRFISFDSFEGGTNDPQSLHKYVQQMETL